MHPPTSESPARRGAAWLYWVSIPVGFAPVIVNLAANLRDQPTDRYSLLAMLLLGLLLLRGGDSPPHRRSGAALIVIGIVAELVGIGSGAWSIARIGLPTALLGLAIFSGQPPARVMILAFAAIPIPDFVHMVGSPAIESALGRWAGGVIQSLGVALEIGGPLLRYGELRLELLPEENGLTTALILAQLGWYLALRSDAPLPAAIARALGFALATLLVQPLLVLIGVATLPLGVPELGRFTMTHAPWLCVAATVVGIELRDRSRSSAGGQP